MPTGHSSLSGWKSGGRAISGCSRYGAQRVKAQAAATIRGEWASAATEAILTGMLEYFSLLDVAARDSTPLSQKRGILDILSRVLIYASPEQYKRYQEISASVRGQLGNLHNLAAPCQK